MVGGREATGAGAAAAGALGRMATVGDGGTSAARATRRGPSRESRATAGTGRRVVQSGGA